MPPCESPTLTEAIQQALGPQREHLSDGHWKYAEDEVIAGEAT